VTDELEKDERDKTRRVEITEEVDPGHKSLAEALHISFFILKLGITFVIIYFVVSGVFVVHSGEAAVKLRFGKIVGTRADRIIKQGIHWAWPEPIDEIAIFPVQKIETVHVNTFWMSPTDKEVKEGRTTGALQKEGRYAITGDMNIVHSLWDIKYRIGDPVKYLTKIYFETERELERERWSIKRKRSKFIRQAEEEYQARKKVPFDEAKKINIIEEPVNLAVTEPRKNVEDFVRACFSNAIIKELGSYRIDDALTTEKESIAVRVRDRVRDSFNEADCGLIVHEVVLKRVIYPAEVTDAFNQVFLADQAKDQERKRAQADRAKMVTEAEGEKAAIISAAKTYKTRAVKSAEADSKYIMTLLAEYPDNPEMLKLFLDQYLQQTIREVLNEADVKTVLPETKKGEEIRITISPDPEREKEKWKKMYKQERR